MRGYGYGYGANAAPAPVPYSKQPDQFLIGIINQYGPQLRDLATKLANPKLSASEKTKLKADETRILTSYWNPAKNELGSRGYKIEITASRDIKITPPAKATTSTSLVPLKPVTVAVPTSSAAPVKVAVAKSNSMPLILLAVAVAGAYWYFGMRKKSPGVEALRS